MTVSDTVEGGKLKYFKYPFPDEGLTIKLYVDEGSAVLYASDIIQTPNEALYNWKIETDGYSDVFLDPTDLGRPIMGDSVFVSIEGLQASNSFLINATFGDTSTNCNCIYICITTAMIIILHYIIYGIGTCLCLISITNIAIFIFGLCHCSSP